MKKERNSISSLNENSINPSIHMNENDKLKDKLKNTNELEWGIIKQIILIKKNLEMNLIDSKMLIIIYLEMFKIILLNQLIVLLIITNRKTKKLFQKFLI